jgi:hypothetical protein
VVNILVRDNIMARLPFGKDTLMKLRQQAQEQIEAARLVYGRIVRDAK